MVHFRAVESPSASRTLTRQNPPLNETFDRGRGEPEVLGELREEQGLAKRQLCPLRPHHYFFTGGCWNGPGFGAPGCGEPVFGAAGPVLGVAGFGGWDWG